MADSSAPAIVVLVAEDETLVRMVAVEALEDAGFQVYEARDSQEALTILEVRGQVVRALVSDITLPNVNGLDLAQIVAERWPHIGIVLASAYPPE
ncbi:MAG TPA: response regulator, partial [Beijerinckiaceae bacterium]|nr:response regulator [Beijerinckiaceae bacterium]